MNSMGSGNFHVEENPQLEQYKHAQVCVCGGGASIQGIRVLIREELEDVLKRLILPYLPLSQASSPPATSRSRAHQAESSVSKRLYLRINDESLPVTLFTMNKIKDQAESLTVELVDDSGARIEDGPESFAKIKFVVLNGDFEAEDNDWTQEDFNKNIVRPRKDKPADLLRGRCEISLNRGIAHAGDFSFTDNSKRSGSVRLAAQAVKSPRGVDIRAAISRGFAVKERRLLCDKKHTRPLPGAELWRLKNISRVGMLYERAKGAGVCKVKDFLQLYHTDPEKMRKILGVTSEAKWKEIVENAEACMLDSELYRYNDNLTGAVLHLDCAFNIVSVSFGGQISQPYEDLNDSQKDFANKLRHAAYEKRNELETYIPTNQIQLQPVPMCSFSSPSMNMQFINVTTAQAGVPVLHGNSYSAGALSSHFDHDGGLPEIIGGLRRSDSENYEHLLNFPTPELSELEKWFDFPNESHHSSKFKAAYYVTKAANIFMVSIQQDQTPLKKKRKLQ